MKPKHVLVISDYLLKNSEGKFVFSTLEICAKHNIQDSTLYRILKSNSVPRRQQHCTRRCQKFPKEFKLSVIRDYLEENTSGFTFTILQICDKFDINQQSLHSFLSEFDIPKRQRKFSKEFELSVVSDYTLKNSEGNFANSIPEIFAKYRIGDSVLYRILKSNSVPRRYQKFSEEFKLSVIRDYLEKNTSGFTFTVQQVCDKFEIDSHSLYSFLSEFDIPLRKRKFSQEFKLSVIRDYLEKNTSGFTFTILQICDKFDIDEQSLYSFLHEFGIPLRNRVLAFEGNITVRKRRSSIKDLECRISEIVSDYNAEDSWGRVYTIKELCERYNTVPIHIYKIFRVARQKGMYLSVRREIQWLD
jgi:transposase-like protein